jgi:type I restriction enzyme R subunit
MTRRLLSRVRAVSKFLGEGIFAYTERPDISAVVGRIQQLLDESVAAEEYLVPAADAEALFDLSTVDRGGIESAFNSGRQRTAAERLRSLLSAKIAMLVRAQTCTGGSQGARRGGV